MPVSAKRTIVWLIAVIFVLAAPGFDNDHSAYGHSGRTDSRGGHYVTKTGSYHYHHGFGPHQHPNGYCPYSGRVKEESTFRKMWDKYWLVGCLILFGLGYNFFKEGD